MRKLSNTTISFPCYTIGENVLSDLGSVAKKIGSRALIIGGRTALEKTRHKIEASLLENSICIIDSLWYGGECTYKNIENLSRAAIKENADVIIGVGGGKALDTAKSVAEKLNLPVITIPTIAATCAATTPLSIVYSENGSFDSLYHLTLPPIHIFIDSLVIAEAPTKYLWAGIGDTIAKYYEVGVTTRGKELPHGAAMAKELSSMCVIPLVKYGEKALSDCGKNTSSLELEQIILNIIISTGFVAMLVGEKNNGAAAHGLFYGLTLLEEIEKHHLHGEVVAYGVLVLLVMDKQMEELKRMVDFYMRVKLPICLKDLDVNLDFEYLRKVLEKASTAPDMLKMPYVVTSHMLFKAIQELENLHNGL